MMTSADLWTPLEMHGPCSVPLTGRHRPKRLTHFDADKFG